MFTSQLYSKLEENNDNKNGVMKWSRKKDIFNKKIVFIPIEKGLHWVLCVVINPGMIHNNTTLNQNNIEITYVLLFNSLRTHYSGNSIQKILNNIKRWLNCVYKCEYPHKFQDEDCTIFDNIKIYQPVGK